MARRAKPTLSLSLSLSVPLNETMEEQKLQSLYGPYSAERTVGVVLHTDEAPLNFSELTGAPLGHSRRLEGRSIIDLN